MELYWGFEKGGLYWIHTVCHSVILSFCHSGVIQFLFNILRMNRKNETKFCVHIIIDKIYVGVVNCCFSQICKRVTALDSRQNLVCTQYLENELTE